MERDPVLLKQVAEPFLHHERQVRSMIAQQAFPVLFVAIIWTQFSGVQ